MSSRERACPDTGTCHHDCALACWRVSHAAPLAIAYGKDQPWPAWIVRANEALTASESAGQVDVEAEIARLTAYNVRGSEAAVSNVEQRIRDDAKDLREGLAEGRSSRHRAAQGRERLRAVAATLNKEPEQDSSADAGGGVGRWASQLRKGDLVWVSPGGLFKAWYDGKSKWRTVWSVGVCGNVITVMVRGNPSPISLVGTEAVWVKPKPPETGKRMAVLTLEAKQIVVGDVLLPEDGVIRMDRDHDTYREAPTVKAVRHHVETQFGVAAVTVALQRPGEEGLRETCIPANARCVIAREEPTP